MANTHQISAPASTSNLGPGFDTLGVSLNLHIHLSLTPEYPAGFQMSLSGEGQGILPEDHRNWILKTARRIAGDAVDRASWVIDSGIPLARGLGSSAASSAVGLAAGYMLRDGALPPRHALFEDIVQMENHPDNAGPTIFGGFRVGLRSSLGDWQTFPGVLNVNTRILMVIPDQPISTPQARSILPGKYSRAAVVRNTQNLATLLSGLARGDWDAVRRGCRDHLHEPYRLPLVPGLDAALAALRNHSQTGGAYLSGAGPTLAAFLPEDRADVDIADEAIDLLAQHGTHAIARVAEIESSGLQVR